MTITNVVLPLRIDFKSWANQLRIATPGYSFPVAPDDEKDWIDWAESVVLSNNFANVPIPNKHTFPRDDGWKRWGEFLIETIYNNR